LKNPNSKISKEGLDLLQKLLEFNQKARPRAAEALKHPFFVPTLSDIGRTLSPTETISDTFSKYSDSGSFSPKTIRVNNDNISKTTATPLKYEQKDSLYLDVGQPLMNGKIDTLNAGVGSANNSLNLVGHAPSGNPGSNPSSLSKFAAGNQAGKLSMKGRGGGGNDLLKAAIFKNAERNMNNPYEESSPVKTFDNSGFSGKSNQVMGGGDDGDDDNSAQPYMITRANSEGLAKSDSPIKRYSLLDNKGGTGNSQAYSKNSKYSEETKSPSNK